MSATDTLDEATIRERLAALSPEIPWAHHFDLGFGIETVTPSDEQFYGKATGLKKFGLLVADLVPFHTRAAKLDGMRVLDVACAEGEHSTRLASMGAEVVGIEGRPLYLERAKLAADVLGVSDRVDFRLGDVRSMSTQDLGTFDLVMASGILHHLNTEAFAPFLKSLCELTRDTCVIYTHIATPLAVERHRLQGPVSSAEGYEGYLFREHKDGASDKEKSDQVRASLDNTHSFWATEASFNKALIDSGFQSVFRSIKPHMFSNFDNASYRPVTVCRNVR
ncbi:MAG: class I SAM-dependent methyltransferase [Halieaceae bacterium]